MDWTLTAQIVAIVAIYLGGILGIGRFVTQSLGKRIDDLKSKTESDHLAVARMIQGLDKRIDDLNANLNARFSEINANINARVDDLRTQMNREHDNLSQKIDAHITNQEIHQTPRV